MTPLARLLATTALLAACSEADGDMEDRIGPEIIVGDDDKGDGATGVELVGFVDADRPVDGAIGPGLQKAAYLFQATAGAKVDVEITQAGSASGLDTVLAIHGPRDPHGAYRTTIAEDDDSGYGALSKLTGKTLGAPGYYLIEIKAKTTLAESKRFRLALRCPSGSCQRTTTPAPLGLDIRWADKSAEYRAASLQAYAVAADRLDRLAADGLPAAWAVVLDVDETTLSNVTYQRERAELGTAYSPASWLAWVQRRAATAMPGAAGFIAKARAMGGKVVLVTNRKADGECEPTRANLTAVGIAYDGILCRTTTSDKNPRFEAIEDGDAPGLPALETVLYVGDNIQDFPNLSQDVRLEGDDAFAEFATRFVVIPNPMYGSWERNP